MNLYYKRAAIFGLGLRRQTQQTQCQNASSDASGGRTHYEILGVHRLATQKEIKDAYLAMSKKVGSVRVVSVKLQLQRKYSQVRVCKILNIMWMNFGGQLVTNYNELSEGQ